MKYRIKKWREYQHYSKRNPPWIKLHNNLLTSLDWVTSSNADRVLMIACMLIASLQGADGIFEDDLDFIKRIAYLNETPNFTHLIEIGFIEVIIPFTKEKSTKKENTETETETETYMLSNASNVLADASSILIRKIQHIDNKTKKTKIMDTKSDLIKSNKAKKSLPNLMNAGQNSNMLTSANNMLADASNVLAMKEPVENKQNNPNNPAKLDNDSDSENNIKENIQRKNLPKLFEQDKLQDEFDQCMAFYPELATGYSRPSAYQTWLNEHLKGATFEEIRAGVVRYQQYIQASGQTKTKFIIHPKNFFKNQNYKQPWDVSDEPKSAKFNPAKQIFADLAAAIAENNDDSIIR